MKLKKLFVVGAIAAVVTAIIRWTNSYQIWKQDEMLRLQLDSQLLQTAQGPIEYSMRGDGAAVLIAHGSPGGYDMGLAFFDLVKSQKLNFITVSRPGYLRTPLYMGKSPEDQADLYAALLDALGIEQAAIVGISGGGPSALQFALRHPNRCSGLALISAVAQRYSEENVRQLLPPRKRLLNLLYSKLIVQDWILHLLILFSKLRSDGSVSENLLRSVTLFHLRKIGYENDMEQFEAMSTYPLEHIVAPTFVVHGTADEEVLFEDAELLSTKIPHVKLLAIEGGSHLTFYLQAKTVIPALREFLESL